MTTPNQLLLRQSREERQMLLPLLKAEPSRPISIQEVWLVLSAQQQMQLSQQLVRMCCALVNKNDLAVGHEEVKNEQ